jgi:hypothetical protein
MPASADSSAAMLCSSWTVTPELNFACRIRKCSDSKRLVAASRAAWPAFIALQPALVSWRRAGAALALAEVVVRGEDRKGERLALH